MLGQLVTHMEQKLNLDSRHLKHQLQKDHGAKWKTDSQSFWEKNRKSSWLSVMESLLGRTQKAWPPPRKQLINWTSILKTSAHKYTVKGGHKALCACRNPQNYVSQTINFHVRKTHQQQPECQGSQDGMQLTTESNHVTDVWHQHTEGHGKRSRPQKWCLD